MATKSTATQFGTPDRGKITKTSARGRVCAADGCNTVLSVYNDSPVCSVHESALPGLRPRRAE